MSEQNEITVRPTAGFRSSPKPGMEFTASVRTTKGSGRSMYGSTPGEAKAKLAAWMEKDPIKEKP